MTHAQGILAQLKQGVEDIDDDDGELARRLRARIEELEDKLEDDETAYEFRFTSEAWERQGGVPQEFRVTADGMTIAAAKASSKAIDFFEDATGEEHGVSDLQREGSIEVLG